MVDSIVGQDAGTTRDYRAWVIGLFSMTILMVIAGVWTAGTTDGIPRPWMGVGLLLAIALAMITGVSKTSSA